MKLTAFLLLAFSLQLSAHSVAQTVTLKVKNATFRTVFREIHKQTGLSILIDEAMFDKTAKITLDVKNMPVTEVIAKCFEGTQFSSSIIGERIVIKRPAQVNTPAAILVNEPPPPIEVKGRVVNDNGEPLASASVKIKGTDLGTATDANGYFSINAAINSTLIISYVGYTAKEVIAKKADIGTITLLLSTSNINEQVVVIGYGTSTRKDITGSVASVAVKDQEKAPVLGLEQMLSGRVSGVEVVQNQSQPGAIFTVRVRGTNSINAGSNPLFVVDGYAGGDISGLSPNDILSIDVLKDASATAIYGSRGANGVIMVTTKRGSMQEPKISIDAYRGVQTVAKKYDMMDAKQFATYLNTVRSERNQINGTSDPLPFTQAQIDAMGKGTDWQDEIFRSARIGNYSLSFNGGNPNSKHYLSFNYFDQEGILVGSDYKKGTIRFNLDQKISNKIKMGISSQLGYSYTNQVSINQSGAGNWFLWDAVRFSPIIPVRNADGTYPNNGPLGYVTPLGNPIGYVTQVKDGSDNFVAVVNTFGEYDILKGLKLRTNFGINFYNSGKETFIPTGVFSAAGVGKAEKQSGQSYNWLSETTLSYDKLINRIHSISVIGGFTSQYWHHKFFSGGITNLSTNLLQASNFAIGIPANPSSSFSDNFLASYFARANYRLSDKYLFTFTVRADGSSRFGVNNKWSYFPSGAFAWKLGDENFIKKIKQISDLKLRLSYGLTGNQEIGSYNSLSQYSIGRYQLGTVPTVVPGASPANIANPDLQWESTASKDIGLDVGLWNNRVIFSADYYDKKTSDLLLFVTLPQTTGYRSILLNTGEVSNKGFEFSVSTVNLERSKLKWSSGFNFSSNKNKVLSLGKNKEIFVGTLAGSLFPSSGATSAILRPGLPIGSFYGYVFDGIWQTQEEITKSGITNPVKPGDPKYKDLNGDKKISGEDRTIIGQARPKFIFGIMNNLSYGAINLNIHIQGVYGNRVLNENLYEVQNGEPTFNKLKYIATDSWHGPGTSNTLPRVSSVLRNSIGVVSDAIENGSYLRFKTITLSYDLPLPRYVRIFKTANIYITGQNLITITKYSGYDPEVNSFTDNNALSLGTDYNAYPNYRTVLAGVKFKF